MVCKSIPVVDRCDEVSREDMVPIEFVLLENRAVVQVSAEGVPERSVTTPIDLLRLRIPG